MASCNRTLVFFLLVGLDCLAQLAPTELGQRIERRIRTHENVSARVNVIVSSPHASEFPNYDAVTVTFDGEGKKENQEFLLSKDQKTLLRLAKTDLGKDPYAENLRKIDLKERQQLGKQCLMDASAERTLKIIVTDSHNFGFRVAANRWSMETV